MGGDGKCMIPWLFYTCLSAPVRAYIIHFSLHSCTAPDSDVGQITVMYKIGWCGFIVLPLMIDDVCRKVKESPKQELEGADKKQEELWSS